jgi:hypothetical protein
MPANLKRSSAAADKEDTMGTSSSPRGPAAMAPVAALEDRVAAASGIAAFAAILVALFLLPADAGGGSAADIAARYSDGSEGYLRAAFAEGLAVACFLVFVAGLRNALARAEGPARTLASAVAIGGTVAAALQLLGYALIATLAHRTAGDADTDVVIALYDLSSIASGFSFFALAVFSFAAGTVMIRTGAISRMLGLASLALGALNLAAAGSLSQDGIFSVHEGLGFLAFALLYLWVLVASIVMLARPATRAVARRGG